MMCKTNKLFAGNKGHGTKVRKRMKFGRNAVNFVVILTTNVSSKLLCFHSKLGNANNKKQQSATTVSTLVQQTTSREQPKCFLLHSPLRPERISKQFPFDNFECSARTAGNICACFGFLACVQLHANCYAPSTQSG